MEQYFTPKEVAKTLKVGYQTILDLINLGELGAIKIGRRFRICDYHLREYALKNSFKSYWAGKK